MTPSEIWDEEEGVQGEANDAVDPADGRDSAVTSLVTESPYSSPDDALPVPIEGPETPFHDGLHSRTVFGKGGREGVNVFGHLLRNRGLFRKGNHKVGVENQLT